MQENLVIVESPAKAKTIEKFLGKDFVVKSSFGHIRDLSKKDLGVNLDKDYEPVYEIPSDKTQGCGRTYRRWPRRPRPSGSRPMKTAKERRSPGTSTEVSRPRRSTKPSESFSTKLPNRRFWQPSRSPRTIDMNLVNAQQARRVLDRLVGFELSPVLWKKVRPPALGRTRAERRRTAARRARAGDHRLPLDALFPRRGTVLRRRRPR